MSPTVLAACCLLALASTVAAQNCTDVTCTTSNTNCLGFLNKVCSNSTHSNFPGSVSCYASGDCTSYTSANGDIKITLSGAGPDIITRYYTAIQNAVVTAYNNYCKQTGTTNYQSCCPGSSAWPNQGTDNNKTAMFNISEVLIPSASGSASSTTLYIRLSPRQDSALCTAVTYTTTTVTTTTTTAAAASGNTTAAAASGNTTAAAASGTATTAAAASGNTTAAAASGTATTAAAASGTATTAAAATGTATTAAAATVTATTAAAATVTATTAGSGNSTNATSGRRKREALMVEEEDETQNLLKRSERSLLPTTITLPANTIAAITSGISLTTVIQSTLSSSGVTVTVIATTVGSTPSSAACNLECNRILMTAALAALLAFSLRRNV